MVGTISNYFWMVPTIQNVVFTFIFKLFSTVFLNGFWMIFWNGRFGPLVVALRTSAYLLASIRLEYSRERVFWSFLNTYEPGADH